MWLAFLGFVGVMLALDLGVFHRKAHAVGYREAAIWSGVWVILALAFGAGVWALAGPDAGVKFLAGWLVEKSLSVDNIFLFVVLFSALRIPDTHQHRVLFWGILSALVLRAAMIFAGTALLERFHWLIYVFGAFLVVTGVKLYRQWRSGAVPHPEKGWAMRLTRRVLRTTSDLHGNHFWVRTPAGWAATPLLVALILVEGTDVVFALDSIPAIFAITSDPFLVFTSNIFAVLGLRSLYFLLAGMMDRFPYLKPGLAAVLVFVGVKLAAVDVFKVPPLVSLAVIAAVLAGAIGASLLQTRARRPAAAAQ